MAGLREGEVVVLAGLHDGSRFVTGVYRATRDLDLDALVAEYSALAADARPDPVAPLSGEVGDAAAVAGCHAWLVAQGLLAPVEARVLEVETVDPHAAEATVRATVSAPAGPEGVPYRRWLLFGLGRMHEGRRLTLMTYDSEVRANKLKPSIMLAICVKRVALRAGAQMVGG